jgi:8-oxo-dGTP diphosphatase
MRMNFCPGCGHKLEMGHIALRERPVCNPATGGCGFIDFGRYSLGVGGLVVQSGPDGLRRALLIERNEEPNRGGWTIPGGFVEFDETADLAVVREVQEETGLITRNLGLAGYRNRADQNDNNSYLVYLLEVTGGQLKTEPDAEIAQVGFFTLEEMRGMARLAALSYELAAAALQNRLKLFQPLTVQGTNGRPPFTLFI